MKRILLISSYFYPELTGVGKYTGEMVEFLSKKGYDCTVVTTYPYYPFWKVQEPYAKMAFRYKKESLSFPGGATITIHRCPQYVPRDPSGFRRMLQDFSFCCSSFFKIIQLLFNKKYDCIISIAPSFMLGLLGLLYKKTRGAKFLYHIQDLQIDAARDLHMIQSQLIIKLLLAIEKYILKNADTVSTTSAGMMKRIETKFKREIAYFPNWADTTSFYPWPEKRSLKKEFGFKSSDKIILYSGAIGEKQGLEAIVYSAQALLHKKDIKFVICGSGPYKRKLEELTESLNLPNVVFLPLQPIEKLNKFLNLADIHLVLQKATASDLVMPSKFTTICSVGGLAIVSATRDSSLYELISANQIGVLIESGDHAALTSAIDFALTGDNQHIRKNARLYAEEFLSGDKILNKYVNHMQ